MSDVVFNIAKGIGKYYGSLPAANDALLMVPLETSGLVTDATMIDYDDLATILAGASNEQTTMGRKLITATTPAVDDTNNRYDLDIADQTYVSAAGNAISKILICYVPDTTVGDFLTPNGTRDATVIPLTAHDFVVTPNGGDIVVQVAASGFYRAS